MDIVAERFHDKPLPQADVLIESIERVRKVAAFLGRSSAGLWGWGDAGQGLWMVATETPYGESFTEHPNFEEEVIVALKGVIPEKVGSSALVDALTALPPLPMLTPKVPQEVANTTQNDVNEVGRQLVLAGLTRAGLVSLGPEQETHIADDLVAAGAYYRADIENQTDRDIYDLLDGHAFTDIEIDRHYSLSDTTAWWEDLVVALDK